MEKRSYLSILLAVVAALALSVPWPAFSEMKGMPAKHGAGHGAMTDPMDQMDEMMGSCLEHADQIGLSEDQTQKMKQLHREMQKKQAMFMADRKIAQIDLAEIMEVKDFDLEKASVAVRKLAELKTAHQLEMLQYMKKMRTMLNDEQFKQMNKLMSAKMDGKKTAPRMMKKHKRPAD